MSAKQTYYELLELSPAASADEIKSAFRRLARQFHPDLNNNSPAAEERFKQINQAYMILCDPAKREQYDVKENITRQYQAHKAQQSQKQKSQNQTQKEKTPSASSSASQQKGSASPKPKAAPKQQKTEVDIEKGKFKDLFDTLFEVASAPFQESEKAKTTTESEKDASKKSTKSGPRKRGDDITLEVSLTGAEAENGAVKTVNVEQTQGCQRCSATGKVTGNICSVCQGTGKVVHFKKMDVKIPAKVKSGSKIRLAQEGGKGLNGGDPGDLYLVVLLLDKVAEKKGISIEGFNSASTLEISLTDAVLGTETDVDTVQGKVKLSIPAGTQSGAVLRLRGKGVAAKDITGDHYVTVKIQIPKQLSPRQKELFGQLKDLGT